MQTSPAPFSRFQTTQIRVLAAVAWLAWAAAGAPVAAQTAPAAKAALPAAANLYQMPPRAPLPDGQPLTGSAANQLIERIQVNDADVRIEEARFGGETRSITVIPKGGFPSYDVRPSTGQSSWKILGF
jgi:hypothetical protein